MHPPHHAHRYLSTVNTAKGTDRRLGFPAPCCSNFKCFLQKPLAWLQLGSLSQIPLPGVSPLCQSSWPQAECSEGALLSPLHRSKALASASPPFISGFLPEGTGGRAGSSPAARRPLPPSRRPRFPSPSPDVSVEAEGLGGELLHLRH